MFGRRNGGGTKSLDRELAGFRERHAALSAALAEAEREASEAHELRRQAMIAGSHDPAHDVRCRAADDRVAAISDAIGAIDLRIVETEQRIAEARDQAEREQEVALRRAQLDQLRSAIRSYQSAAEQLAAAARALGLCTISSGPVGDYVVASTGGALQHAEMLRGEAESYLHRVEAGTEVIAGRSAPQPPATPPRLGAPAGIAYRPAAGNVLAGGLAGNDGPPLVEAIG